MRDPEHRALIPLVEASLAVMRLSCENFFSLAAVSPGCALTLRCAVLCSGEAWCCAAAPVQLTWWPANGTGAHERAGVKGGAGDLARQRHKLSRPAYLLASLQVFAGYLVFRDPPPLAQRAIVGVARLSHAFQVRTCMRLWAGVFVGIVVHPPAPALLLAHRTLHHSHSWPCYSCRPTPAARHSVCVPRGLLVLRRRLCLLLLCQRGVLDRVSGGPAGPLTVRPVCSAFCCERVQRMDSECAGQACLTEH